MTSAPFAREQRGRWFKGTVLRPLALASLRWRDGPGPLAVRAFALHRAAFPYLRARDEEFEHPVNDGVFVATTTDMLGMYVRTFGVWEPYLTSFMRSRLREGDVFVDVGANIGWYTLMASRRVGPTGVVVAVEPCAPLVVDLERQIERNGLTNVRVIREAVSDHVGRVALDLGPAENTGATTALRESTSRSSVPCRPLPDMLHPDEFKRVRLIKIDVEGAEYAAVRGFADVLPTFPDEAEVVVEVGPRRARAPHEVAELFEAFHQAGYTGYLIPNAYGVRDYLEYAPIRSLPRVDERSISSQVDIVFSRRGADVLLIGSAP